MSNNSVVEALKNVLANSYSLYLKTQNYHWNIESPNFKALHVLFEEQYTDLAKAIDTIAELIRALGEKAPGTFDAYIKRSSITPGDENASAQTMLEELLADQLTLQKILGQALTAAQQEGDEVVVGFVTDRLTVHRKAAWMLKSSR